MPPDPTAAQGMTGLLTFATRLGRALWSGMCICAGIPLAWRGVGDEHVEGRVWCDCHGCLPFHAGGLLHTP